MRRTCRGGSPRARLAYVCSTTSSGTNICVANAEGSGRHTITHDRLSTDPAWSPDGTRIAIARARQGTRTGEIYLIDPDGTHARQLTHDGLDNHQPRWSHDGTRIAFVGFRGGQADIFVMNADGSGERNITNTPGADESDPDWAPDGTKLLFTRSSPGSLAIYNVNLDGTGNTKLGDDLFNAAIAPDGIHFALVVPSKGIFVGDFQQGSVHQLTKGTDDSEPAWSSDGTRLAFRRGKTGPTAAIWVMHSDGTHLTRIVHDPGGDLIPTWAP